jgi:hypothetical protein
MPRRWIGFTALMCVSVALCAPIGAQESAPVPAKTLLQRAEQKDKKPTRTILVLFHASW